MASSRFALALDQIGPDGWRDFEVFASEFLAVEYPSLRTMASRSGDRGRDGELFSPEEEAATTVIQYSVSEDWKAKITATVKRLSETMPSVRLLIYTTNQQIGPAADDLKKSLRVKHELVLDVYDRSWFLERELTSAQRQTAAAELAERFVDPLLRARGVTENIGAVLSDSEAKIALLHLSLDIEDKASQKGLTKSCFESLVQAAMDGTDVSNTMSRDAIIARVEELVPSGEASQVRALADSAISRLSVKGGPIHYHKSVDQYCLSNARVVHIRERMARYVAGESSLEQDLADRIRVVLGDCPELGPVEDAAKALRASIEQVLFDRGEGFAQAVATGRMTQVDPEEMGRILKPRMARVTAISLDQAVGVVFDAIQRPSAEVQQHLHRLADAYTLFAFLRQTPDVQKAVVKMFSGGRIWLDATVILPMIAETLVPETVERQFTVLLRAARDAGISLFVTDGIIEEVERHINLCLAFARACETGATWRGRAPFLYAVYAMTGRGRRDFAAWAREFRGETQPEADVAESIREMFGVNRRNLLEYSDVASIDLRSAVQEVWQEAHDRRRSDDADEMAPGLRARLVAHDVENCVGVMQLRNEHPSSPMGYRAWYLTMDHIAFRLVDELPSRLGPKAPASPIMSPDFLTEYLRVGFARTAVENDARINLPILTDISRLGALPLELLQKAEDIRIECAGMSERLIRRQVRDTLDRERLRLGVTAFGGLQAIEDRFAERVKRS